MRIKEVAKLIEVSESTLRMWEVELELDIPRRENNREYGDVELGVLNIINNLRKQGKGYLEIKTIISDTYNSINNTLEQSKGDDKESQDYSKIVEDVGKMINALKINFDDSIYRVNNKLEEAISAIQDVNSKINKIKEIQGSNSYILNSRILPILVDLNETTIDTEEIYMSIERYVVPAKEDIISTLKQYLIEFENIKQSTITNNDIKNNLKEINLYISEIRKSNKNDISIRRRVISYLKRFFV